MEGLCRGCLNKYDPEDLLQYCESNRRLFVYCTGLQVKRNDAFTFQLCKECYLNMKFSCKFKKQCRNSDRKFKNFLALKKEGENIDFSTFLKNNEDTLVLRLPVVSRANTPSHQIGEDDDNVSTCTSIQNFMTDIFQGEEMLPTEARIVREVIQEEADILDDSLDSHWLQDDISVNSDFEMDFNFSTFSTPHSIRNDHCYTPRRISDDNKELNYYISNKPEESSDETQMVQRNDMPILDVGDDLIDDQFKIDYGIKNVNKLDKHLVNKNQQIDMPLLDVEFDGVVEDDGIVELADNYYSKSYKMLKTIDLSGKTQHNDLILQDKLAEISKKLSEKEEIAEDSPFSNLKSFKDCLFSDNNGISPYASNSKSIVTNEEILETKIGYETNEFSIILNKGIAGQKVSNDEVNTHSNSPFTQELEKYINKAKYKKSIQPEESKTLLNAKETHNLKGFLDQENIIGKVYSPKKRKMDILKTVPVKRIHLACNINKSKESLLNEAKCSIDRNLELALKNNESEKFSLDQLLMSPQENIRSGASTPTINNILFGTEIPKERNSIIEPTIKTDEKKELDSIEEFLKDNHAIHQSTPKKDLSKVKGKPYKGFNDKHESQDIKESKPAKYWKQNRGMKDIKMLKELLKFDDDDQAAQFSDDNQTVSSTDDQINIKEKDIDRESLQSSEQENKSNNTSILEESKNNDKGQNDNYAFQSEEIDDLDISISNLLNLENNQSDDLNISISSDFLKDDKSNSTPTEQNVSDDLFKKPLSPPDGKYDFDACYCKICDITFISPMALKRHFTKVHKVKIVRPISIICHICATKCTSKSNFNRHMATYHSAERYQCDYCKFGFPTKGKLSQHMRAHRGGFTGNNKIQDIDENEDKKKFVCNTCGKVIKNSTNFKIHQRRHTKSYTMTCEICQKGFYRKEDLQAHMSIHTNVNEFACQYCPKTYRRRALLMHHVFRHLGIEKYGCEPCGKRFVSNEILKRHCDSNSCLKKKKVKTQDKIKSEGVTVIYSTGSNDKIKEIALKDFNTD